MPCEQFGISSSTRIATSCGYVAFPNGEGGEVRVPYLRTLPAQSAETPSTLETIVIEPGGPGESGIEFLSNALRSGAIPPELAQRASLLSIDHRGTGRATPDAACRTFDDRDWERRNLTLINSSLRDDADIQRRALREHQIAERCRAAARRLSPLGATSAADEINAVVVATGTERVSVVGVSYGTRVAMRFGANYSSKTGRLVLDGVVTPTSDRVADSSRQLRAAYDTVVTRSPDGDEIRQLYSAAISSIVAELRAGGEPRLSIGDLLAAVLLSATQSDSIDLLNGLRELSLSGKSNRLTGMADIYFGRLPSGRYQSTADVAEMYQCADSSPSTNEAPDLTRQIPDYDIDVLELSEGLCTPELAAAIRGHEGDSVIVPTNLDILSAGHQVDIVASQANSIDTTLVQRGNRLRRIVVPGIGHGTLFRGNRCVDALVASFLLEATHASNATRLAECPR
ncbi:alpha/beta hydrolase [Tsukamurella strandjordii]|uniref:alpha/beta hydrolase n=1 Tax=Tsukamurella strandjordii TaxID=147577 RepID=UPI0031DAC911